jgi:hypothetical protein
MHVFMIEIVQLERKFGLSCSGDCAEIMAPRLEHVVGPLLGGTRGGQEQHNK